MEESYPVTVQGVELIAERPARRDARLLRDGEELPKDVWGKYLLTGTDGEQHRLEITFSQSHASPALRVDDDPHVVVLEPLPRWARTAWIALAILCPVSVLVGHGYVLVLASLGALLLLNRPGRDTRRLVAATVLVGLAVVAQIALLVLL